MTSEAATSQQAPDRAGAVELLPALDLRRGRVVRLRQGDDTARTIYGVDPLAILRRCKAAGVARVHLVDLDAAFGEPQQRELLERLVGDVDVPAVQLGGGLRDRAAVEWAFAIGCSRVVIGSMLERDFELLRTLAVEHPGRLVVALDVRGDALRLDGWRKTSVEPLADICARLRALPLGAVLVTDVERDGMLEGPNLDLARRLALASGAPALLSGGVASLDHLRAAAAAPEIGGVIVGKALLDGAIGLEEALRTCAGDDAVGSQQSAVGQGKEQERDRVASSEPKSGDPAGNCVGGSSVSGRLQTADCGLPSPTGLTARIIPCLDVRAGRVVKGVRFADLRDQGDPAECARRYAEQGADEIVFLDVTAAPESRGTDLEWVERTARSVFVPLTVGGGCAASRTRAGCCSPAPTRSASTPRRYSDPSCCASSPSASAASAWCFRSTHGAWPARRRAAGRSSRTAAAPRPAEMRSSGSSKASAAARGRSCSPASTVTAPRAATTSTSSPRSWEP